MLKEVPINIGVDIEDISRFESNNLHFLKKILTAKELKKLKKYNPQRIAGIFCAKEAIIKACSNVDKFHFKNIEIFHRKSGAPHVVLRNSKKIQSSAIKVSISHTNEYAAAVALLVTKE